MKRIIILWIATAAHAMAVEVATKISAVTVYADRARVHREGAIDLPAGVTEFTVGGLPGWIDDDSVRAALMPGSAGRIADVRVTRTYLARSNDEEVRRAEAAVREIEDKVVALQDEVRVQDARQKQVEDIRAFSLDRLPKDAAVGQLNMEVYGKTVDFVTESSRAVAAKKREIAGQLRDLQPELQVRQKRLAELRARQQLEQASVVVVVEAASAAKARLGFDYITPGAAWEPVHELRAEKPRPEQVVFVSYALVSQTTGEDWTGAELSFSTQSPDAVMRVPELTAMRLDAPAAAAAVVEAKSFQKAAGKFAAANTFYNSIVNGVAADYDANYRRQNDVQMRVTGLFSELQQKRGTTAHFSGEGRPQVRSDGSPVRVRIGQVDLPAIPQIVAVPELSLSASHIVELTNNGRQPLLPGRVSLHQAGAFLGTTEIKFVAEGEKFAVLMGVADRIKLSRVLDRRNSSLVSGGERKRMQVAFDLAAENLGAEPVQLRLQDRVPVSENKEIRVSGVDIEPSGKPDDKGLLAWNLTLGAGEKKSFRIAYVLEYPAVVTAPVDAGRQMRMRQSAPAPQAAEPMPANPNPGDALFQTINDLELKF